MLARRLYHSAAVKASASSTAAHISAALGLPAKSAELLEHSLDTHVPALGFSEKAVLETLRDHGYSTAARSVFPNSSRSGEADLVLAHLARSRAQLLIDAELQQEADAANNKPASVADLVKKRLLLNSPIVQHLAEAQAILTQPGNAPAALQELHALSDDIWHLAGDRSHSADWYAKRAGLSALYVAAELVMSQDTSSGFRDTLEFVDRRIEGASDSTYVVGSVAEFAGFFVSSSTNVLKSLWARG